MQQILAALPLVILMAGAIPFSRYADNRKAAFEATLAPTPPHRDVSPYQIVRCLGD